MTFVPTLNFNGKCRKAMKLYQKTVYGAANDSARF